ncbi:MAG: precorrin-3B C(17)-methyltransferase [Deltaproteobacteria bacterium]|nr:precorrin-3B C(17)-methyltransferase [Deltaproteobacteria bacterium]
MEKKKNKGIAVFYVTERGKNLAHEICKLVEGESVLYRLSKNTIRSCWNSVKQIVIISALGVAVRFIAPFLKDKSEDPGVIVVDELGKYCISLLSGHSGEANRLALRLSRKINAKAVITTSSDLSGYFSPDLWAKDLELVVEDKHSLTKAVQKLLQVGYINVYLDNIELPTPSNYIQVKDPDSADLIVSYRRLTNFSNASVLRPKVLCVGIGFNTGTKSERIFSCLNEVFERSKLSLSSIYAIGTINKKETDKEFLKFMRKVNVPVKYFTSSELNSVPLREPSINVFNSVGAYGVAEPASLLLSETGTLIVQKTGFGDVTIAVALRKSYKKRKFLKIVGIGPGAQDYIIPLAKKSILEADVVVGYEKYLNQIDTLLIGKEIYSTGMTFEVERCRKAIELASQGKNVVLISGGDPNVYGMAGLVLELISREFNESFEDLEVSVIPGISALNVASALLGGPLVHDFACISLSDRLTPWEKIEKRLENSAQADMVIVLYNPRSTGRKDNLKRAIEIISRYRSLNTPVGVVKAATRENQLVKICELGNVRTEDVDMETTLIIGNSSTYTFKNFIITPRGYRL